ncbi:hypothetical protein RI578_40520 (plasmid) [Streptomyces sp. BB1-1-1]|uniref:hypothetical protein n=1 Tax=Streptomyces sp. BB1-1-1 TaxID=3074430 RepID=UPI0028779F81|nr:hypothetical protein [Streptomyces sp. BB1-1-1]WND40578.1 hypothetical protein RI578_40520 [Streptomyces sp. BB1-1-1]
MAGSPGLWAAWGEFGKYNAQGMKGGEALILELNRIVYTSGISSPVTSKRGMNARLRYLNSAKGREAMREQGITDRAMKNWYKGKVSPSAENRQKIDNAYWTRRRENLIRSGWLKRHLDNNGRGRQVEIYPVDERNVPEPRRRTTGTRRDLTNRSITVRYLWGALVDAWAAQDEDLMDEIWDDVISDLDSDYTAYAYVSAVGIGA